MSDLHRQRRARNYALGGALLGLAVLFFLIALVKFGGGG
jgi:hypothetical protein